MPPAGKSQPPKLVRDARIDSNAPVPMSEDIGRPSSKSMKTAREVREDRSDPELEEGLARLKAERAADADDLAKMLVRVADTERARDASEKRATGLEAWTQELESKVAAARTRADDADELVAGARREREALRKELERARSSLVTLEGELVKARQENDDALEVEREKRSLEIDDLVAQHDVALEAARGGRDGDRSAKLVALIEELARAEAEASAVRQRILERARHLLTVSEPTTAPPPPPAAMSSGSPTMPPTTRNGRKRSRRPSAPPAMPVSRAPTVSAMPAVIPPVPGAPDDKLETFEDLNLEE